MAHWIIDDHGFGGQFYKCSNCGDTWCDIYNNVSMEEQCPSCGEPIDEDATEYIEKAKNRLPIQLRDTYKYLREYEKLEHKVIELTGYDLDKLVELFAAGYTLRPPKYNSSLVAALEEGDD